MKNIRQAIMEDNLLEFRENFNDMFGYNRKNKIQFNAVNQRNGGIMKNIAKKILMIIIAIAIILSMSVAVFAEEEANPQPGGMGGLASLIILYGGMIALFYFLFMRPQKKKMKQEETMRNALQVGDEVVMTSGILGKIINIKDDEVTIETSAARTQIKFMKNAVARVDKKVEESKGNIK